MKYYFYNNSKVVEFKEAIDTRLNKAFVELTTKQKKFYQEHKDASVCEIRNCELNQVITEVNLSDYVENTLKNLKEECSRAVSVSNFELAMAMDKVNNTNSSSYYNINEAKSVMNTFRSESKTAMGVYDKYKELIEAAESIDDVNTLFEQARQELYSNE